MSAESRRTDDLLKVGHCFRRNETRQLARPAAGIIFWLVPATADRLVAIEIETMDTVFFRANEFDRLLAAQALELGIPIVSKDTIFDRYGVQRFWR